MPIVPAYHSVTQTRKREAQRIYHDNDRCSPGRDIPQHERLDGDGGYRRCIECTRLSSLQNRVVGGDESQQPDVSVDTHEVDPAVFGAHSHDHAHSVRPLSSKLAAHDHSHLHHDDPKADNELNGHSHAGPHLGLPWES